MAQIKVKRICGTLASSERFFDLALCRSATHGDAPRAPIGSVLLKLVGSDVLSCFDGAIEIIDGEITCVISGKPIFGDNLCV